MYTPVSGTGSTLADRCGGSQLFLFMSLIETIFRSQSDIMDTVCDPPAIERPDTEYDFIVVGAGSAGCVVAARLSENPLFRVLLIEAGGPEPLGTQVPVFFALYTKSPIDWQYSTQPNNRSHLSSPNQRSTWPAGKVLGGTSAINYMMYVRGNPEDFDRWSALGNEGWDYESVLPFFRRAECNADFEDRYHGRDGPLPVEKGYQPPESDEFQRAAREMGLPILDDCNGARQSGFVREQSTKRSGVRFSTARAYLDEAWDRPNLDVWLHTLVSRVLLEEQEDGAMRAIGVVAIDRHNRTRVVHARKEVIVSAGTVGSPKVLLQSGIGEAEELIKVGVRPLVELPGVGRNLHDHVGLLIEYQLQRPNRHYVNVDTVEEYLQYRSGILTLSGAPSFVKFASRHADGDHDPDCQLYLLSDVVTPAQLCSQTGAADQVRPIETLRTVACLLRTKSRGHIRLASADPFDSPLIYPNQLGHPDDLDRMLEPIEMSQRMFLETSVFRRFNVTMVPAVGTPCQRLGVGTPAYWRCEVRHRTLNMYHQVGSCRMGPPDDELMTVVDAELRVHGVRDLRVIDASVMPTIVSGNTNAATIMIGEKGVDAVRKRWEVDYL